jgi:hypothetical protein
MRSNALMLLFLLACDPPAAPAPAEPTFRQDTVLLVWMPYDNNLGDAVGPVLAGLRAGSAGGVQVAVQVDRPDQPGMERLTFVDGVGQTMFLAEEDSGSGDALTDFLEWAAVRYDARKYGLVVLDHGGDLSHVARDDSEGTWLSVGDIDAALRAFDADEAGQVELLFLQVCGKASVEPLLELQDSAHVTLASQLPLAAPNTWYESGLLAMGQHPEWSGQDWARAIATADGPQMFGAYTCVDNRALARADLAPIELTRADLEGPLAPVTWPYGGEIYVDLDAALAAAGRPALSAQLMCGHWTSAGAPPGLLDGFPPPDALSGLSVAVRQPPNGPVPGLLVLVDE